jgi:hypothetical protein
MDMLVLPYARCVTHNIHPLSAVETIVDGSANSKPAIQCINGLCPAMDGSLFL